jgi:predicted transcriptional regulator
MKLYDAEYKFMSLIWDLAPVNSTELSRVCLEQLGWKKPTTYNMIRKLAGRGLIKNEKATVTALVPRENVQKYESETLLEKSFEGSLPAFLTTFFDDKKISQEEADELKKIIEEAVK